MDINLFEYAARNKLRIDSTRGPLNVEMLWDVPLRSRDGFDLDTIAKTANKALKVLFEESFVSIERTPAHERAEVTLEIVKRVISVKLTEEATAKRRAENSVEKEKLLRILAEKQEGKLSALTEKELQKRIRDLET